MRFWWISGSKIADYIERVISSGREGSRESTSLEDMLAQYGDHDETSLEVEVVRRYELLNKIRDGVEDYLRAMRREPCPEKDHELAPRWLRHPVREYFAHRLVNYMLELEYPMMRLRPLQRVISELCNLFYKSYKEKLLFYRLAVNSYRMIKNMENILNYEKNQLSENCRYLEKGHSALQKTEDRLIGLLDETMVRQKVAYKRYISARAEVKVGSILVNGEEEPGRIYADMARELKYKYGFIREKEKDMAKAGIESIYAAVEFKEYLDSFVKCGDAKDEIKSKIALQEEEIAYLNNVSREIRDMKRYVDVVKYPRTMLQLDDLLNLLPECLKTLDIITINTNIMTSIMEKLLHDAESLKGLRFRTPKEKSLNIPKHLEVETYNKQFYINMRWYANFICNEYDTD